MVLKTGVVVGALFIAYSTLLIPVIAHEGHEHEETVVTSAVGKGMDIAQMEQLISLMEQLVLLLSALHIQQGYAPVTTVPVVDDHADMDAHHDEHGSETKDEAVTVDSTPKLVIELETHNGKTHAHVRYVDKPEDMFFVDVSITDEDGVVAGIVAKTGLAADEVKSALKYME
jgi:hypothetical protein